MLCGNGAFRSCYCAIAGGEILCCEMPRPIVGKEHGGDLPMNELINITTSIWKVKQFKVLTSSSLQPWNGACKVCVCVASHIVSLSPLSFSLSLSLSLSPPLPSTLLLSHAHNLWCEIVHGTQFSNHNSPYCPVAVVGGPPCGLN